MPESAQQGGQRGPGGAVAPTRRYPVRYRADEHLPRRYRLNDDRVLTMQTKTREVLDCAERWLSAVHAVTAADQAGRRSDPEQAVLDTAEVELATAIMDWRNLGRPD